MSLKILYDKKKQWQNKHFPFILSQYSFSHKCAPPPLEDLHPEIVVKYKFILQQFTHAYLPITSWLTRLYEWVSLESFMAEGMWGYTNAICSVSSVRNHFTHTSWPLIRDSLNNDHTCVKQSQVLFQSMKHWFWIRNHFVDQSVGKTGWESLFKFAGGVPPLPKPTWKASL